MKPPSGFGLAVTARRKTGRPATRTKQPGRRIRVSVEFVSERRLADAAACNRVRSDRSTEIGGPRDGTCHGTDPRRDLCRPGREPGDPDGAVAENSEEGGADQGRRLRRLRHRPAYP